MTEGLKILTARKEKKFSQRELASKLGVSQQTIAAWETNSRALSADQLQELAGALGKPLSYFHAPLSGNSGNASDKNNAVKIPIYEAEASAGHGCLNDTEAVENFLMIDRETIRGELQCNPDNLAIVRVRGDSMKPTIKPGEMVVVDKTVKQIVSDGLYVMRLADDLCVVKRAQAMPGGKLNVISDNKAYPPYQINLTGCGKPRNRPVSNRQPPAPVPGIFLSGKHSATFRNLLT